MFLLPKITKKIPAALTAIIVVACITIFGDIDVSTVGSFIRDGGGSGLKGGLPTFQYDIFSIFYSLDGHWDLIISTAFLLAAVGLIESLMTLNLVDELTETRGSGNRECVAQGGANIINGLFGDPFYNSIQNIAYNGIVGRVWFITGMIFPIYFGFKFRKRAQSVILSSTYDSYSVPTSTSP